jgi:hypothetical protein
MTRIIPTATLLLGFGLGAAWGYHSGSHSGTAVSRDGVIVAREASPFGQDRPVSAESPVNHVEATECAAFRQELAKALQSHKEGPAERAEAATVTVTPEVQAARRAAQSDIETLVAGGVWGNEQRSEFRTKLVMLDSEQQRLVMQNLVLALNSGAVKLQTSGPPF